MKMSRPIRLIFLIILMSILIFLRFYFPTERYTADQIRIGGIVLNLAILLLIFRIVIDVLILWYKLEQRRSGSETKDNLIIGLTNLFRIISVMATILALMSLSGLELKDVFTTLSIVAAAIAIVTKDFITEIIIGIVNGFSTKIELDDYVKIGEQKGKIIDIGLQKITLLNDEDDLIYIPNVKFYNSDVINYTRKDIRRMGVEFQLDLKYLTSVEDLEKRLTRSTSEMATFIEPGTYNLKVMNITKDTIDFNFQYTMIEVSREVHRKIRKLILRSVANIVRVEEQIRESEEKNTDS